MSDRPKRLAPLYDALEPDPEVEYGTLMPWATNRPGSAAWVQQGANPRLALPDVVREGLGGVLDLLAGTETGEVTPRAAQSLAFGGLASGGALAPRGALAAGGGPIRAYLQSDQTYPLYGSGRYFTTADRGAQRVAEDQLRSHALQSPAFDARANQMRRGRANDERAALVEPPDNLSALQRGERYGYEANLHVDPRSMIDWHAPMNWQPPAALKLADSLGLGTNFDSGRSLYKQVRGALGERDSLLSSDSLVGYLAAPKIVDNLDRGFVKHGIPGVKYGAADAPLMKPRDNYVMFPGTEESIEILRRYGLAAPAPMAMPSGASTAAENRAAITRGLF